MSSVESKFEEKIKLVIIYLLMFKLIYVIIVSLVQWDISYFLSNGLITILIFLVIYFIIGGFFSAGFSGFGGRSGGSYGIGDQQFNSLMDKYEKLTEEYIEQKQYKKAAYIQLKLLKNPYRAAHILKEGGLYTEAAILFLKRCKDKEEAANCYELARSYTKAIQLLKELKQDERIGDIYVKMGDTEKANTHYQKVIDEYVANDQYVKASLIYRKKMMDKRTAKDLLISGWRQNKDAVNCLNNYFAHYDKEEWFGREMEKIYQKEVNFDNELNFLKVIGKEYKKRQTAKENIQDIAYEIISRNAQSDYVISELNNFVQDRQVSKDIIKHRLDKIEKK